MRLGPRIIRRGLPWSVLLLLLVMLLQGTSLPSHPLLAPAGGVRLLLRLALGAAAAIRAHAGTHANFRMVWQGLEESNVPKKAGFYCSEERFEKGASTTSHEAANRAAVFV